MKYRHVSSCPKCGAPIYEEVADSVDPTAFIGLSTSLSMPPPTAYFTCDCRKTLPASLPDVDGNALETTAQADRRTLARTRVDANEGDSEERVDERH